MSRMQWILVLVLIVGGILLQIPEGGGDMAMPGDVTAGAAASGASGSGAVEREPDGPYRTLVLDVTGMT